MGSWFCSRVVSLLDVVFFRRGAERVLGCSLRLVFFFVERRALRGLEGRLFLWVRIFGSFFFRGRCRKLGLECMVFG